MVAVMLYITTSGEAEAARIAQELVADRLCACANVIGGARSFYWWDGALREDREGVLIAKTTEDRLDAAIDRIRALHSAELPCVVAVPITGGNGPFLDWIAAETHKGR